MSLTVHATLKCISSSICCVDVFGKFSIYVASYPDVVLVPVSTKLVEWSYTKIQVTPNVLGPSQTFTIVGGSCHNAVATIAGIRSVRIRNGSSSESTWRVTGLPNGMVRST